MAGQWWLWPFRRHGSRLIDHAGESDEERARRQEHETQLEEEYLRRVRRIEDEYVVHRRGEDDDYTDQQRKEEDAFIVDRRSDQREPK